VADWDDFLDLICANMDGGCNPKPPGEERSYIICTGQAIEEENLFLYSPKFKLQTH